MSTVGPPQAPLLTLTRVWSHDPRLSWGGLASRSFSLLAFSCHLFESSSLPHRHGLLSAHRTILHKAGVGMRPVAPHQQAGAQGALSHRGLPAQPPDGQSAPTALEATHLKNPHIGLPTPSQQSRHKLRLAALSPKRTPPKPL